MEEEIEQQPQDFPIMPQYAPMGQIEDIAGIIKQLDPREEVEMIRHRLMGEEFDYTKNEWTKVRKPLMNDKGVRSVMINVNSLLNLNTIMSKLDEKAIGWLLVNKGDTIISKLIQKREEFGIDKSELDTIHDMIMETAECALKRADKAITLSLLKKTTQEVIQSKHEPKKKRFGIFGR